MSNHKKANRDKTIEDNERPEWDWIRKKQNMIHSNRKSILYHLQVLDEESEISVDLSEYPC